MADVRKKTKSRVPVTLLVIPNKVKKLLLVFLLFSLPHAIWAKKYDPPKLSATEVIQAAKDYVTINNITINNASFISEVTYKNIYNEYEPAYWSIKWHVVPRTKNSRLEIQIYNNGKIRPQNGTLGLTNR